MDKVPKIINIFEEYVDNSTKARIITDIIKNRSDCKDQIDWAAIYSYILKLVNHNLIKPEDFKK